jgi:hypothetical protein
LPLWKIIDPGSSGLSYLTLPENFFPHPPLWLTVVVVHLPLLYVVTNCSGIGCSTKSSSGEAPGMMTFTSDDLAVVMPAPRASLER